MSTARHPPARQIVARLAAELRAQIETGKLAAGAPLPSVRQLARERGISPFSAAEIYNSLVATGALEARAGLGYFVATRRKPVPSPALAPEYPGDSIWERRREAHSRPIAVDAGAGWLPGDWLFREGVQAALRQVGRLPHLRMEGYGNPLGLIELRSHLTHVLDARGIAAREDQILLTQGTSQALDLLVRECLEPGDAAIVEDPAYPPVYELLRQRGVELLAVPRTESGPDTDALAKLL
jgi:DNA-binding transcriptional MocR family regulator